MWRAGPAWSTISRWKQARFSIGEKEPTSCRRSRSDARGYLSALCGSGDDTPLIAMSASGWPYRSLPRPQRSMVADLGRVRFRRKLAVRSRNGDISHLPAKAHESRLPDSVGRHPHSEGRPLATGLTGLGWGWGQARYPIWTMHAGNHDHVPWSPGADRTNGLILSASAGVAGL
jgi:hypothetical protein